MPAPQNVSKRRAYEGPAIFSFGFRPFFLGGSLYAVFAIALWVVAMTQGWADIGGHTPLIWHIHEMVFGFFAAIAVGFLLTAVPNWTGRLPVVGSGLAVLAGLWLLGRAAMLAPLPGTLLEASLDGLFLVAFAAFIWREVLAAGNMRNLPICVLVTLLAASNIAFHFYETDLEMLALVQRAALAVPAMLIALIGGRVVPSFTRNWLAQKGNTSSLPAPVGLFDKIALLLAAIGLLAWAIVPLHVVTGIALLLTGGIHGARLLRWRGWLTGSEALLWILHVGYGWLALAMALLGLSIIFPEYIPASAALHALTAGAMGVMILAMMTRATLGHTGRDRTADGWTIAIYVLVICAAVLRVASGWMPIELYLMMIGIAGFMWAGAFGLFALRYGPMLVRPR